VLGFLRVLWGWLDGNHPDPMQGLLDALAKMLAVIGKGLLLILVVVVGTAVVRIVGGWIFGGDSITIASFTDTRAEASAEKGSGLGHTLTDALTAEIHRINQLHTLRNPWASTDEVPPLEMTGPQAYERVGSISVAGLELPVGEVALALRPLLPSWYDRYVISGSIQRALSGQTMEGQIVARLEENGRARKHWNRELPLHDAVELHLHLRQLAYEIMWHTLVGIEANSLGNFQDLIEGIQAFRTYKDTRDLEAFAAAKTNLEKAIKQNPRYARAHFYLGNLYTWRARYEPPGSDQETDYTTQAINAYEEAGSGYTSQFYEADAFKHFGRGLIYYRMYLKMKKHPPPGVTDNLTCLDFILNGAIYHFSKAVQHDDRFYFARTGRALIYREKAELYREQAKLSGRRVESSEQYSLYLTCAVREFRHAKFIAAYRKDSLRWLDMNIGELERTRRKEASPWSWLVAPFSGLPGLSAPCPNSDEMPGNDAVHDPAAAQDLWSSINGQGR
jgi:hypothetical protein